LTPAARAGQHGDVTTLPPYAEADDASLADGVVRGDTEAWTALLDRYGRLVETVVVRVVDERRGGARVEEVPGAYDVALEQLRRNEFGPFRTWGGACTLRHYLAVLARASASAYLQDVTPPAALIAALPTPAAIFLDEIVMAPPAREITDALDRLPPNVGAVLRLRLRGLDRGDARPATGDRARAPRPDGGAPRRARGHG
jgi:hypothetical protein